MPNLREATLRDYDAIAALEKANGLKSRSREEWSRYWTENPVYRSLGAKFPIGWVLEDEETGKLVGTLSNIPLPYSLNRKPLLAATGRGWAVDPEYRAFAPLLLDEYFNQNADVLLSTTVNGLAEASHTICEQTRVPVGDWAQAAFRITNYAGFAKVAMKLKNLPEFASPFAGSALWIKDKLKAPKLPAAPHGIHTEVTTNFDGRFDDFWDELQNTKQGKLLGVRNREALEWHFGAQLQAKRARIIMVTKQGRMRAYAVLVRSDHASSGLTRLRLADFQTLDPSVTAAIVRRAVQECEHDQIHAFELVGLGVPALAAFEAVTPYRRKLPAWCYFFHSNDDALMSTLRDANAWEPSSFDGDSSI